MRYSILLLLPALACFGQFKDSFATTPDRPWPGPEYWSNPLQDWRIQSGRLENHVAGGDRNVALLTYELAPAAAPFSMEVRLGRLESDTGELRAGFAGFRFGIRGAFKDYRDSALRGEGVNAGITTRGELFIGKVEASGVRLNGPLNDITLRLEAAPGAGETYSVKLTARRPGGETATLERDRLPAAWFAGLVALAVHNGQIPETPTPPELMPGFGERRHTQRGGTLRVWFRDWKAEGAKFTHHPERAFGPVLFAMHTLSRRTLKLTAQLAPVAESEARDVHLEARIGNRWQRVGAAVIDRLARTATFRVPNWDDTRDTPYRVVYGAQQYTGTVRRDPRHKPALTVAAFTGNNDLGFPHADVVRNVTHFRPDLLAFTGDNIYERVADYGIEREPLEVATLDYLRKWYLFGWEYRELLKDIPAVAIPDDHDVYQGNIWGAGGRASKPYGNVGQDKGGYVMDRDWVNMVHRTQVSNLPDPVDPEPVEQGISVYHTELRVGGISFAVIADRMWKSAPQVMLPKAKIINGWAQNPEFDSAREGDVAGAELLGPRQERFLAQWAKDWSDGVWMKTVISQTIFANVATLPKGAQTDAVTPKLVVLPEGEYARDEAPVQDHDSNGWPQTPRNRALRAMRQGLAFHIAGDQHLGSTIQYGIDEWNDAGWAICVPSVANVWPRRWFPPAPGHNQKPGAPKYTGEFLDGFGNRITVHAVSNPHAVKHEPAALMHRAPGYGIVTFDRRTRNLTIANWPRWVDATRPGAKPYEGWPMTIHQLDNGFPKEGTALKPVPRAGTVIQVVERNTGEIAYTYRTEKANFVPMAPKKGTWEVKVIE